jgi:hypothetical protein
MKRGIKPEKILVLYIPWVLSLIFRSDLEASYFIAWLGSFVIFYLTLSGWVRPLPDDLPVGEQLMRPIFLVQIIFAGYTCCTSIFYFFDVLGYDDFHRANAFYLVDFQRLSLTAECQRYYCLGHAAFVTGMLFFMDYPVKQTFKVEPGRIANLLYLLAVITLPLSIALMNVPGLSQFSFQFNSLSFIAGTLALAFAIPLKKIWNTLICLMLYLFNFYQALISGYKEPIIVSVLVLGIFLYPNYKKVVLSVFVPALLLLFIFLPTYNRIFRQNAWSEDVSADQATQLALDAALGNGDEAGKEESNWEFLAYRLSEIDMFTNFVKSTPDKVGFYGFKLLEQSAVVIVPRIFWPSKPNTEDVVMERVYDAGVINRGSNVSAKPAFIVDAYLCGGGWTVFLCLFLYGAAAQLISMQAERLFGGYVLGTALIFSGLFQIFWRGLSFEFLINSVFWSYISMLLIHRILIGIGILQKRR